MDFGHGAVDFCPLTVVSYQSESVHQNESSLACPHSPSSYEGRNDQEGKKAALILMKNSYFDMTLWYIFAIFDDRGGKRKERSKPISVSLQMNRGQDVMMYLRCINVDPKF